MQTTQIVTLTYLQFWIIAAGWCLQQTAETPV